MMDSGGNSGSMQSSSTGGDEEYDSRADPTSSFSAFLNSNTSPYSTQHHVFNPLSNYQLDPTQRPQSHNQILNNDMVWSKVSPRSQPDLTSFMPSSSPHNNQSFLLTQLGGVNNNNNNNVGAFPTTLPPESASPIEGVPVNEQANSGVRNPKKRSRASRRAPTTVLTTDTTNFRAMVQEFTGIPAPPFTSSSFPRSRLDLFASNSNASSGPTQTQTPPYLLRPFAHKVQAQPSSIPPASSFPPMFNNTNYHSLNLNMHNPILSFHSILQPHPLGNNNNNNSSSILVASKTTQQQQPSLEIPPSVALDSSHLKMGGLEELGLSHAHVAVTPHQQQQQQNINNMRGPSSSADWAHAQAQRIGNNNDGYRSTNVSDIHGDKGPECTVAARSEGMLESWINCSSD